MNWLAHLPGQPLFPAMASTDHHQALTETVSYHNTRSEQQARFLSPLVHYWVALSSRFAHNFVMFWQARISGGASMMSKHDYIVMAVAIVAMFMFMGILFGAMLGAWRKCKLDWSCDSWVEI